MQMPYVNPNFPTLINEKELSWVTGRSLSSLRKDRMRGNGVPFIKFPGKRGKVSYDMNDVTSYLAKIKKSFTTESPNTSCYAR